MTAELVRDVLAWSSVINLGLLLLWALWFMLGHDFIYRTHSKWFSLSEDRFDAIHYASMGFYKICILMFNIVPYLALRYLL
jgi:hypothetical protein